MNRQQDIQRTLEDFKGVKNIPGIKSAKERVLITKIKDKKGKIITPRKVIASVFGEFYKNINDDNEQEESEQEIGESENENSIDVHNNNTNEMTRIQRSRQKSCELQSTNLKKVKSPDSNGIRAEDIKDATMRRKIGETNLKSKSRMNSRRRHG